MNIDGDCCHHVDNSVKVFSQLCNNFVGKWIDDLHTDNTWSTDIRDAFFVLNILFRMLPLRISHGWLTLYDCLGVDMTMFDVFVLLYYSWVPDNEKHLYKEDICFLYEK